MKKALPVLLLVVAAACASNPNQSATQPAAMKVGNYSADMGESPVGVIPVATLHDGARNKDVGFSIDYPTRGGSFPVIVFSPGYGLSDHAYEPLVSYWTSNGYVVIRVSHADAGQIKETQQDIVPQSVPQNRGRNQRRPAEQQATIIPLQQNNPAEQIWDREREPQWKARVADVELVISSLDGLERQFPELAGKMDHSKVAVAGHGYGAFTALLAGGMRTTGNPPLSLGDPRVKAIVALSPPGVAENRDLTAQSFADIHVPVLFMTGSNDRGGSESENAAWRKESFVYSPAGDKYFVLIDGARYSSFSGQTAVFAMDVPSTTQPGYGGGYRGQQPQQPRGGMVFANSRSVFGTIKITSVAFLDAYLKNDTSARDLLQPAKYESSFTAAHMSAK